jgi:hypothetical protein
MAGNRKFSPQLGDSKFSGTLTGLYLVEYYYDIVLWKKLDITP